MAINPDKIYNVKNRSAGTVSYRLPELGVRRVFAVGEVKRIKYSELEALAYIEGGRRLMLDYLQIEDPEATRDLGIPTETEYWMSEEQIVDLLQHGSYEAFLDCLDFAPDGVVDLVKKYAISLPLNDMKKRQAIKDKTGFDVTQALKNLEPDEEKPPVKTAETAKQSASEPTTAPTRRITNTNYKIINKN